MENVCADTALIDVNAALNELFFDGRFAGVPVYLSLNSGMRLELAHSLHLDEVDVEGYVCTLASKSLDTIGDPYQKVLLKARQWQRNELSGPPPFTDILFCLSHAAELMAAQGDFAASNYYVRLSQITGFSRDALAYHGRSTDKLWKLLNEWLLVNDYQLGRPTARAINTWRYVGKALSQAVVRASDRELFHDLFERFGFSGGERLATEEMGYYLENWIHSSKPNARLKAAWQKSELRERVCEAAIAELSGWTATSTEGNSSTGVPARRGKLSMVATMVPSFPTPSLELLLGRTGGAGDEGPYKSPGIGNDFFLSNTVFGGFSTISPSNAIPIDDILTKGCQFVIENNQLFWQSRLIIPFAKSDLGPFWVETTRVAFGAPHLLLVRDVNHLPVRVEGYLAQAALGLPRRACSVEMKGLPPGWVLYQDVRVRHPDVQPEFDLQCLVPLLDNGCIIITGGTQLLPSFYHSASKLGLELLAAEGPTRIEVTPIGEGEKPSQEWSSPRNTCEAKFDFDLCADHVTGGFVVTGWSKDKCIGKKEVFPRDANRPSPIERNSRELLCYNSIVSAKSCAEPDSLFVTGMVVYGESHDLAFSDDLLMQESALVAGEGEVQSYEPILSTPVARRVQGNTCVERGYHYWICETLLPGLPTHTPLYQTCRDCKTTLIVANRGRRVNTQHPMIQVKLPHVVLPSTKSDIDHEVLLDALCFLGRGTWGKFESLCNFDSDPELRVRTVAENLSLLGFLDLEIRQGTNQVKSWSVPEPVLNFIDERTAYLSGFRWQSLIEAVATRFEHSNGRVVVENIPDRPPAIWVSDIDIDAARPVLETIRDPLGRCITITSDAASAIASACLNFDGMLASTQPVTIGNPHKLQHFDMYTAKWNDVTSVTSVGAYRWNDGWQVYAFIDAEGQARVGPYQVIKLLAARASGTRLHGVDGKGNFLATLGCEPPGLLGRALVSASGKLPTVDRGLVSYTGVASNVASTILEVIYNRNI